MAIGTTEILIIVLAAVFLFGGKKVVDWARAAGQAKKAYQEEADKPAGKKTTKKVTKK